MQPLARVIPRLAVDSITSSTASRTLRYRAGAHIALRPSSIRLQCKFRAQTRGFADNHKPLTSSADGRTDEPASSEIPEVKADIQHVPEHDASELPSAQAGRRAELTKRFSQLMDHMQGNIFIASQRINDLTGYSGIEALKTQITALEVRVAEAQDAVRASRLTYKTTVADRASTQREVTGLLARKDTWNPADLERFTALYRMDHTNEQAVVESAQRLADAEREAEHASSTLSSSILSRYHEEQIWSDKIRRMSTWGTWGLMGVNVLLFLVFQFGFEPWRRRRLVSGFEEKVREALDKERELVKERQTQQDSVMLAEAQKVEDERELEPVIPEPVMEPLAESIAAEEAEKTEESEPVEEPEEAASLETAEMHIPTETPIPVPVRKDYRDLETWKAAAKEWKEAGEELFSEKVVVTSQKSVTIIALEGAATGAAVVVIIATLFLRSS